MIKNYGLPKINVEKIINECQIKNEDYTIGTFFHYQKIYREMVKRMIDEERKHDYKAEFE